MDSELTSPVKKSSQEITATKSKIASQKKDIFDMNLARQSIKIPQRNLIYQHRYLKYGNRNIENENRLKKMKRKRLSLQIKRARNKINILKSSI